MPNSNHQLETTNEPYDDIKHLRSSTTKKRLRRLHVFERTNYKKTYEVKKTGHNLEEIHRLDDGNLRYATQNLTYSLNKKKRWLLPEIIQKRICEYDLNKKCSNVKRGDQQFIIDERLKIIMYENENVRRTSTCIRYGNSQTEPHILYTNGKRFNSITLTQWINFNTWERQNAEHRHRPNLRTRQVQNDDNDNRVNQPNFGIQNRPGFFPSEVTYEFLYPKRLSSNETYSTGKTSLSYTRHSGIEKRRHRDTNKSRRRMQRIECTADEYDYDVEQNDLDTDTYITTSSNFNDDNENWSILIKKSDDQRFSSLNFPIECFISSKSSTCKVISLSKKNLSTSIHDPKAHKYFEPWSFSEKNSKTTPIDNEDFLCSIACMNESDFLSSMQQSKMKISQANLSPPIFVQQTSSSSFSVIYSYCRSSSTTCATLKFIDLPPNIFFDKNHITLITLIELISKKLNENQLEQKSQSIESSHCEVDALRGSLPLPLTITQNMILVRPNSTDKLTALKNQNLIEDNDDIKHEQWFDTTNYSLETLECLICCATLTSVDAYQLLPCHHTLCHSCLKSFICTSVSSATYSSSSTLPITCFEQNCSTELNPSLLQAFLSYEIYETYKESLTDRRLFLTGCYRKCPSRVCSKLLIVDDKTKSSLMCSCGQRVCSECIEEYHFPATCKQYKRYATRLNESGDDLLSVSKIGDNSSCYIAEGKNCPNCGEFVEKNGGCPHMTCKCGNEYCWMCLKRWSTHNYGFCTIVPESTHELRSSTRNRLHNKAINHRRERNQYSFELLLSCARKPKIPSVHYNLGLSAYIDLNTLAEFIYVVLQCRRTDINIRAVLTRTAKRLENDAYQIKLQIQSNQVKIQHIDQIRSRLQRSVLNLQHMKKNNILI